MYTIPVVMTSDKNHAFLLFVSLSSLFSTATEGTTYDVHVFISRDFGDENFKRLNMLRCKFSMHHIHIVNMQQETIEHSNKNPCCYELIYNILSLSYAKCLFINTDAIIVNDLSELFSHNTLFPFDNHLIHHRSYQATSSVSKSWLVRCHIGFFILSMVMVICMI